MRPSLCILGGGSPFTVPFFEALAASEIAHTGGRLTLYGRDHYSLSVLAARARCCLYECGWEVSVCTDLLQALEGASHVIHQIRYGGFARREEGERLARTFGVPADETLGPAALYTACLSVNDLRETARSIAQACPDAWVLNLTNPLSVTTAMLIRSGVRKCIGICELPETTAAAIATLLDAKPTELDWSYAGLNHRGYLFGLKVSGQPVLSRIQQKLPDHSMQGVLPGDIEQLQAVPMKYHGLLMRPAQTAPRAAWLVNLRSQLLAELEADPTTSPPSLQLRMMDWYEKAVIPILTALITNSHAEHIVNVWSDRGLVIESKAHVGADGVVLSGAAPPPDPVQSLLRRLEAHEIAVLRALEEPGEAHLAAALSCDPTVTPDLAAPLARDIQKAVALANGLLTARGSRLSITGALQ